MAERVLEELAELRKLLTQGIGEVREEVALLRASDTELMTKLSGLEERLSSLESGGAAAVSGASTAAAGSSTGTSAAAAAAAGGGDENNSAAGAGSSLDSAAEIASINAKAVFDEQEARAKKQREEPRLKCVQCDRDYYESYNAEGECVYHSGTWVSSGSRYRWTCCDAEFRNSSDADYVEGCQRKRHCNQHHNAHPYFRYAAWLRAQVESENLRGWAEVYREDEVTDCKERWVEVGVHADFEAEIDCGPHIYILMGDDWRPGKFLGLYTADAIVAAGASGETLIREMTGDGWFIKAEWIIEEETAIGVRLSAKATQEEAASTADVLFSTENDGFELVSITRNEQPRSALPGDLLAFEGVLPPNEKVGEDLTDPEPPAAVKYKSEGDSPLRLKPAGNVTANQGFGSGDSFTQYVTYPILVINPDPNPTAVTEITMSYQNADGEWVDFDNTELGTVLGTRYGEPDCDFSNPGTNFNMSESQTLNVAVRGSVSLPGSSGSDNFRRARVAAPLPQPLIVRATFEDLRGCEVALCGQQFNKPLGLKTREDKEADAGVPVPVWVYADDAEALDRRWIAIYRKDGRYEVSIPNQTFYLNDLDIHRKKKHQARSEGVSQLSVVHEERGGHTYDVWLLYDAETDVMFGLRARVELADGAFDDQSCLLHVNTDADPPAVVPTATTLAPGAALEVSIVNNNPTAADWLDIFPVGLLDRSNTKNYFNRSETTEIVTLRAPVVPGEYEIRLFSNDSVRLPIAVSEKITVVAPE